jgi:hypothetical protein
MNDKIKERFATLLEEGKTLIESLPPLTRTKFSTGEMKTIPERLEPYLRGTTSIPKYQAWLSSVTNLLHIIAYQQSPFAKECDHLMSDERFKNGVPSDIVLKMYGLLEAANKELEQGLLQRIEYVFVAATFDDFLDHATFYHKGNKTIESSVLASAVLEDTAKKIASKHSIQTGGLSLEQLIEKLYQL